MGESLKVWARFKNLRHFSHCVHSWGCVRHHLFLFPLGISFVVLFVLVGGLRDVFLCMHDLFPNYDAYLPSLFVDGALLAVEAAKAGFTVVKLESSLNGKAITTSFLAANGCTANAHVLIW